LFFGILVKNGSWFKVDGEEKNLGQGLKSVYARLADDEDLRNRITSRLLDFTDEDESIDLARKQAEAEEARAVIADAEMATAGK
jgi:hypothetical protein